MGYASWSVVFGEQPSAAKWNILGTNDSSFNDSSGLSINNSDVATVATSQTTTSTSYTDLATAGPSITVVVGASGKVLVLLATALSQNTNNQISYASFVASGANTIAASDANAIDLGLSGAANFQTRWGAPLMFKGLNAGSTTFKMQYRVDGGTGTYSNRTISVVTL